jgi:hypothetical protein
MAIESKLFFELLVAVFYPVPFVVKSNQIDCRQMVRHMAGRGTSVSQVASSGSISREVQSSWVARWPLTQARTVSASRTASRYSVGPTGSNPPG